MLFAGMGTAGAAAPLALLFRSLFWFAAGSGAVALAGSLGRILTPDPGEPRAALRLAMSAVVLVSGLVLSLVVEPAFTRVAGDGAAFARLHAASVAIAFVAWAASGIGLVAGAVTPTRRG